MARELGLPLIIHSRDAHEDTLKILTEERVAEIGGVMHCYAYDWEAAQAYLDLGLHISLSGIVTFNSANDLREVARKLPAERLLVETDAPYLTPVPHRGKANLPGYVRHVAECVATERDQTLAELAGLTTANFQRLFGCPLA